MLNQCKYRPGSLFVHLVFFSACVVPRVTLIPSTSNLSSPLEFRRNEDFYMTATVEENCSRSLSVSLHWSINSCSLSNCLNSFPIDPTLILMTSSEFFVPARTLPFGIYQLKVIATTTMNVQTNQSAFVRIIPSGLMVNLVPLGTSMITQGSEQNLQLNPGLYSLDLDEDQFNVSDWNYQYFCRIYGASDFPRSQGVLLPIDDSRHALSNASCFNNRSGSRSRKVPLRLWTILLIWISSEWISDVVLEIRRCSPSMDIVSVDRGWVTSIESNVSMDGHDGEQTEWVCPKQ